ncbi:MAG: endonuclease/exonuclease/phosphatase family protein [Verrucomicrobiae bacterium]|nr:endonuclease/exonuclease/phosphatase family protein [Verrucomicrobiae bacterium]
MKQSTKLKSPFTRTWVVAALLLTLLPTARAEPLTQVKVMSFNIWVQGAHGLSNVVEAIRTSGADLVGLQECNATTAQTIATGLGFYVLPASGCSIVSRFPIVDSQTIGSSTRVTIEPHPGQRLHLFNCHLPAYPYGPYDLKNGQSQAFVINQENQTRMSPLNLLLNAMQPWLAGSDACFLTGDFNAPSHLDYADFPWPTSVVTVEAGLGDSYREMHPGNRKFPGQFAYDEPGITWTPRTDQEPEGVFDRIDFVYYSLGDGATPTHSIELDARNSANPWPSDHRAVLTTFTLTPPTLGGTVGAPFPADNATSVRGNVLLTWLPASNMVSQAVYFGTNSPGELRVNTTHSYFSPGSLLPGTTYFWRVDTTTTGGVVTGSVWSFTTAAVVPQTYEWTFALSNLTAALGKGVLAFADAATSNLTVFGATDGATVPHIGGQPAKFMRVPQMPSPQNGYLVTFTESDPNGGGVYLNQYTIIQDLLVPSPLGWAAMFNTNPGNANDADFYIGGDGSVGIAALGYSSAGIIAANTWYRIAVTADLGAGTVAYYVNGTPVHTRTGGSLLDGRFALYSNLDPGADLLLFNEGDGSGNYTHQLYLAAWAFVDRTLTAAEVSALGAAKAGGIFSGPALKASVARDGDELLLSWDGGKGPFQVQRTASLLPSGWDDASSPSYERMFSEPVSAGVRFFRVVGN